MSKVHEHSVQQNTKLQSFYLFLNNTFTNYYVLSFLSVDSDTKKVALLFENLKRHNDVKIRKTHGLIEHRLTEIRNIFAYTRQI